MKQKRFIVSAFSGGSGKTLCSLGLLRSIYNCGHKVLPFKKGPDYIDTTWLSLAAKKAAYNLDPFFLEKNELRKHFYSVCSKEENAIALIEGNRGLYDGRDIYGSASTAELAVTLDTPVLLVINAQKVTRTLAALINGIIDFDPRLSILGLIFNNVASARHEKILYDSISHYCAPPIFGFIPRYIENPLPERHLGLQLNPYAKENEEILDKLASNITEHVELDNILHALDEREEKPLPKIEKIIQEEISEEKQVNTQEIRIGYIKDKAIWFYYTENLEALIDAGATLVELSLFDTKNWDSLDGLYIGGGYPEVYAEEITNSPILEHIKKLAEDELPIYAECGGFMLLARSIENTEIHKEKAFKMANIFPIDLKFYAKPQGLGYIEAEVMQENSYFKQGEVIRGHEFHYSLALSPPENYLFKLKTGTGMGNKVDALQYKKVFASYTHIYALTHKEWAKNIIKNAKIYKEKKKKA